MMIKFIPTCDDVKYECLIKCIPIELHRYKSNGCSGHYSLQLRRTMSTQENAVRSQMPQGKNVDSNITIELLNVQSLLPKLPHIVGELQQRSKSVDNDILCFTETNLKSGTPNHFINLPGYNVFREDRKLGRKKSGGGVAIYIRNSFRATRIATPAPPIQSHTESLWLSVKLNDKRAMTIGCIYRPPSTTTRQVNADYDDIEKQLQAVIAAHPAQGIALAGDLNSDARTSPAAYRRLLQLEERYRLCNVVHKPTFFRGNSRSVLDVVLLSEELCSVAAPYTCTVETCHFVSHHCRVLVHISVPRVRPRNHSPEAS